MLTEYPESTHCSFLSQMLTARDSSPQRPQTFSSCVLQNKQAEFPCLLCRRDCPIRWNTAHPIPVFPYGSLSFLHSLVASARFPGPNSAPQGTLPILSGQLLFSVKLLPSYKVSLCNWPLQLFSDLFMSKQPCQMTVVTLFPHLVVP